MKEYQTYIPEISLKFKTGDIKKVQITSSKDAANYLRLMYDTDTIELSESVIVVFLNRANKSIGWMKLSQGGIAGTIIDVKLILATAIKCGASSILLSHNHPSGNKIPSEEDIRITNKTKEACKILDITLIDHIIVMPEGGYYSFADDGLL